MIKKLILILVLCAFFTQSKAYAQEEFIALPTISVKPSIAPTPINYELPFPGILPGTPLYSVKVFRDKLSELMTSTPFKKSEFYLLQADKKLAASLILFKNGDDDLAIETLESNINYLEMSYEKMIEADKMQESVLDIHAKIKASNLKQLEEIENLMEPENKEKLEKLQESYNKAKELRNKVNAFSPS